MKIKSDYKLRTLAKQNIVIATGAASHTFNGMIKLNETGAFFWKSLEIGCTTEELILKTMETYQSDEATVRESVLQFIETLGKEGILEEEGI